MRVYTLIDTVEEESIVRRKEFEPHSTLYNSDLGYAESTLSELHRFSQRLDFCKIFQ